MANLSFSQRLGLKPQEKSIQIDSMDLDLRNSLWNILQVEILDQYIEHDLYYNVEDDNDFLYSLWHNYFKKTVDSRPRHKYEIYEFIKKYFFETQWYDVYDMVEFAYSYAKKDYPHAHLFRELEQQFNTVLKREFAGYRFIDGVIGPFTNTEEVATLNLALTQTKNLTALNGANKHLSTALIKISDRANPDYRNSVKESISAVESVVNIINGNKTDTLGQALSKLKISIVIHPALEGGFKQIYGYTSDASGIRHAITDESTVEFEDAQYMLVSCSAFINYLIAKAQRAGIKLT